MPNYCSNRLLVTGHEPDVEKLFDAIKGPDTPIDFEKIVPIPQEIKDLNKKTALFPGVYGRTPEGANQYYEDTLALMNWQVANWGTKWNACWPERDGNTLRFETAWSPPVPIVRELHRQHPTTSLVHFYKEEGMCFAGEASYLRKEDSALAEWQPGVAENEVYAEGEDYRRMYPEEFDESLLEQEIPIAGLGITAGTTLVSTNQPGDSSMTTATENKEAATSAAEGAEKKLTKREKMALLTEQHVATVKGLLDLDTGTGAFSGGDGFQEAVLLEGVTMDMIQKVDEQQQHNVVVGTRAMLEMAGSAYKLNHELKTTTGHLPLIGKNRLEVDSNRDGTAVIRLRQTAVNAHAGELKQVVGSFADSVKALEQAEAAETAAK